MPKPTCQIEHRKPCKKCGDLHENKASGLCDKCWSAPKEKKLRLNPLDLVRGRK